MDEPIQTRRSGQVVINNKKRKVSAVNFTIPADQRINVKQTQKARWIPDFAVELKKL